MNKLVLGLALLAALGGCGSDENETVMPTLTPTPIPARVNSASLTLDGVAMTVDLNRSSAEVGRNGLDVRLRFGPGVYEVAMRVEDFQGRPGVFRAPARWGLEMTDFSLPAGTGQYSTLWCNAFTYEIEILGYEANKYVRGRFTGTVCSRSGAPKVVNSATFDIPCTN